ncbi:MAG: DUF3179 domain-containing (seleno)protein [Solirubrobacterales bacterium]
MPALQLDGRLPPGGRPVRPPARRGTRQRSSPRPAPGGPLRSLVASALDTARIPDGREVGSAAVFSRIARRRALKFEPGPDPGTVRDTQTDSTWDMSGRATAGPLAGTRLQRVPYHDQFWFALAAFFDDAEIRR